MSENNQQQCSTQDLVSDLRTGGARRAEGCYDVQSHLIPWAGYVQEKVLEPLTAGLTKMQSHFILKSWGGLMRPHDIWATAILYSKKKFSRHMLRT